MNNNIKKSMPTLPLGASRTQRMMMATVALSMTPMPTTCLVPHSHFNGKRIKVSRTKGTISSSSSSSLSSLCMYFDDCERKGVEEWELSSSSSSQQDPASTLGSTRTPWMMSPSEEKQMAMEQFLGFNLESSKKLSIDQIEDETLQWALDTKILGFDEDDDEEEDEEKATEDDDDIEETIDSRSSPVTYKYDSISDLIVASEHSTSIDSLSLIWELAAKLISTEQEESVHLIVFPTTPALWDYNQMVTMLQAIQICKSMLVSSSSENPYSWNIKFDLFHPHYKNSPRMWSPEYHSPFPTIGMQIVRRKNDKRAEQGTEEDEIHKARSSLQKLFDSVDAVPTATSSSSSSSIKSPPPSTSSKNLSEKEDATIVREYQQWVSKSKNLDKEASKNLENELWDIQSYAEPYQVYATIWNILRQLATASQLQNSTFTTTTTSATVLAPGLDAHTLHRIAVTVNVALQKLNTNIRIDQVRHPNNTNPSQQAPRPSIHFVVES